MCFRRSKLCAFGLKGHPWNATIHYHLCTCADLADWRTCNHWCFSSRCFPWNRYYLKNERKKQPKQEYKRWYIKYERQCPSGYPNTEKRVQKYDPQRSIFDEIRGYKNNLRINLRAWQDGKSCTASTSRCPIQSLIKKLSAWGFVWDYGRYLQCTISPLFSPSPSLDFNFLITTAKGFSRGPFSPYVPYKYIWI